MGVTGVKIEDLACAGALASRALFHGRMSGPPDPTETAKRKRRHCAGVPLAAPIGAAYFFAFLTTRFLPAACGLGVSFAVPGIRNSPRSRPLAV